MQRYHRQMLLPGIGEDGQRRLAASHALIVGCGALGCVIADSLARAGVGTLTIVDRDLVEITNLQRQILYDENDVAAGLPKAEAAKARLQQINSEISIRAHVDDFNHQNAERYAADVDILLDGLDNFETRYLLNDLAVSRGLPYIYGGAVGVTGVSMSVLPDSAKRQVESTSTVKWSDEQATPCLRCVFPEAPPPGATPTCDTAGVLGPIVSMIAAHQAAQAIKLLTGNIDALDRSLLSIDAWGNETRRFDVSDARNPQCPCCGAEAGGRFQYLHGDAGQLTASLCGRDAVQISPPPSAAGDNGPALDLAAFAARLAPHGRFMHNRFLLRGEFAHERGENGAALELTLFPNGRAIIKGVSGPQQARTLYAKYVGM
jgi:molybdopterin-synthase adenylyltransferase